MKKIILLAIASVLLSGFFFSGCIGQPSFTTGAGSGIGPQNVRSDLANYVAYNATGLTANTAIINLTNPEGGRTYYVSYFSASSNDSITLALQRCTLINNYSIVNCTAAWKTVEIFTISTSPYIVDLTNNPIKIVNGSAFRVSALSTTAGPAYVNFIYQNISGA